MSIPGNQPDEKQVGYSIPKALAILGIEVGCLTGLFILIAILGGLWLDRLLGTRPWLTIVLVVGLSPVSLFLVYRLARRASTDMKIVVPKSGSQKYDEEEESRE
jgi:membrane protein implicated in regulation of membrane protease activity